MQFMELSRTAILAFLLLSTSALSAAAADAAKVPTPKASASHPAPAVSPSLITGKPDGTIVVQKRGTKDGKGLMIPPQVIVPVFSPPN